MSDPVAIVKENANIFFRNGCDFTSVIFVVCPTSDNAITNYSITNKIYSLGYTPRGKSIRNLKFMYLKLSERFPTIFLIYRVYKKKLNRFEIALNFAKQPLVSSF
jgi:hypothetical protein